MKISANSVSNGIVCGLETNLLNQIDPHANIYLSFILSDVASLYKWL